MSGDAVGHAKEAGVLAELRPPDHIADAPPLHVARGADEYPAVLGLEHVPGRRHGVPVADPADARSAAIQETGQEGRHGRECAIVERHVDSLAATALPAQPPSGEAGRGRIDPGHELDDRKPDRSGRPIGHAGRIEDARQRLDLRVREGETGHRPAVAEGGDVALDPAARSGPRSWPPPGIEIARQDEDIAAGNEPLEQSGIASIVGDTKAPLAGHHLRAVPVLALAVGEQPFGDDHGCAELRQERAADSRSDARADFDNDDAFERRRPGHDAPLLENGRPPRDE